MKTIYPYRGIEELIGADGRYTEHGAQLLREHTDRFFADLEDAHYALSAGIVVFQGKINERLQTKSRAGYAGIRGMLDDPTCRNASKYDDALQRFADSVDAYALEQELLPDDARCVYDCVEYVDDFDAMYTMLLFCFRRLQLGYVADGSGLLLRTLRGRGLSPVACGSLLAQMPLGGKDGIAAIVEQLYLEAGGSSVIQNAPGRAADPAEPAPADALQGAPGRAADSAEPAPAAAPTDASLFRTAYERESASCSMRAQTPEVHTVEREPALYAPGPMQPEWTMPGREGLDAHKICFIICTTRESYYSECVYYLSKLRIPEGYAVEILPLHDVKCLAEGYDVAMRASDARYKVYMHQDVFLLTPSFLEDLLCIFSTDARIGMVALEGAPALAPDQMLRSSLLVGNEYDLDRDATGYQGYAYQPADGLYDVEVARGMLLATSADLPWRPELFDGMDGYDLSQSYEFHRAGYRVVVPEQRLPWCAHYSGAPSLWRLDRCRKLFVKTYLAGPSGRA